MNMHCSLADIHTKIFTKAFKLALEPKTSILYMYMHIHVHANTCTYMHAWTPVGKWGGGMLCPRKLIC